MVAISDWCIDKLIYWSICFIDPSVLGVCDSLINYLFIDLKKEAF